MQEFDSPRRARWQLGTALCAVLALLSFAPRATAQVAISIPSPSYFGAFSEYNDGNYREALGDFLGEVRGGMKVGSSRWIDSICYYTMAGECYYQMGQHQQALAQYTSALQVYYAYSDWMVRVQFPALRPSNPGEFKPLPWGRSTRNLMLAHYPDSMPIIVGNFQSGTQVIQQGGGTVLPPTGYQVNVQEIVRCTALAMRRRRELMGPACAQDSLTADLIAALSRRPGPPNHWSECWIDLLLGIAYTCGGKDVQAKACLDRAIVAGGQYDHPLTSTTLLELGRLSLMAGDYKSAENYFTEASYAAGVYLDPIVVDESLRLAQLVHIVTNRPGIFAPLTAATVWAKANSLRELNVSTQILAAECYAVAGQPQQATPLLASAASSTARRTMFAGKIGARWNYVSALVAYQLGDVKDGDRLAAAALAFQKNGSLRLFHVALVDSLYTSESISARSAFDMYNDVLRDPTPADWASDPLESLSTLSIPHLPSYANWFEAAYSRKDYERMLEISDLARRHRFLSTLDYGGRLHNLRWLLEAPEDVLDTAAKLERQDLLARYPDYEALRQETTRIKGELKQLPLVPEDPTAMHAQAEKLNKLASIAGSEELMLRQMALRREAGSIVFPPYRTTKQIKAALPSGHALLSFFSTPQQTYALLITHDDNYRFWRLPRQEQLSRGVMKLLQSIGNAEGNHELSLKDLQNESWKETSRQIGDALTKDARADLKSFKQLIIVPDGVLWHLPFELMQVKEGESHVSLVNKVPIRYVPLASLGVGDTHIRRFNGQTAIVLGKLTGGAEPALVDTAFEQISQALSGATAIRPPLPHNGASFATLLDGLITLDEIHIGDGDPFSLSPLPHDQKNAAALSEWFELPFGGPDFVILPALHTAAERALKKSPAEPGQEIFLSVCGLMANGARTILVSRWRTGGQSSVELVREFVQELPHATASEAWQRSVMLVSENSINPAAEPRVRTTARDEAPTASHPFFWAGYLLVDTGVLPEELASDPTRLPAPANPADAQAKPAAAGAANGLAPAPGAGFNAPGGFNPAGAGAGAAPGGFNAPGGNFPPPGGAGGGFGNQPGFGEQPQDPAAEEGAKLRKPQRKTGAKKPPAGAPGGDEEGGAFAPPNGFGLEAADGAAPQKRPRVKKPLKKPVEAKADENAPAFAPFGNP